MFRWSLLLAFTLAHALAAPESMNLSSSPKVIAHVCYQDPPTCTCAYHLPYRACQINLSTCNCFFNLFDEYPTSAGHAVVPAPPANASLAASRAIVSSCHVDMDTCSCSSEDTTYPDQPPIDNDLLTQPCFTRSLTCQCSRDSTFSDTVTVSRYNPGKTCVIDYKSCSCLLGDVIVPGTILTTTTKADFVHALLDILIAIRDDLVALLEATQQMAVQPLGELAALSVERREQLVAEPIAAMTRLIDLAGDEASFGHLTRDESAALAARLREVSAYLRRLRDEPVFLAAQLAGAKVMTRMLRELVAAMEESARKTLV